MSVRESPSDLQTKPQQSHAGQSVNIQEQQVVNEQTSNLDVSTNVQGIAKIYQEECDLLSRKSLERVSPQRHDDEVTIRPFY